MYDRKLLQNNSDENDNLSPTATNNSKRTFMVRNYGRVYYSRNKRPEIKDSSTKSINSVLHVSSMPRSPKKQRHRQIAVKMPTMRTSSTCTRPATTKKNKILNLDLHDLVMDDDVSEKIKH